MFNGGNVSLADIAAVTGRNNGDGWNNGGDWWAWILAFALFGGWGNGGFGFGGNGNGAQSVESAVQRGFDTQTIVSKLDNLGDGLCSLGYDQLAQFNGVNTNVMQSAFGLQQQMNSDAIANMQQFNALQSLVQSCCCENRQQLADLKYDMATSDCSIKTLMNQLFQQLQWGQQAGLRDLTDLINDRFNQLTIAQKDAVIADLQAKLNGCDRDNALQAMAQYLLNNLSPRAVPAYPAANPNGCGSWPADYLTCSGNWNGCGRSSGCCGN